MLGHCHILISCHLKSRVLGFLVVWIYTLIIIRYQLILLIDVKQCSHAAIGNMSIQFYYLGLIMH